MDWNWCWCLARGLVEIHQIPTADCRRSFDGRARGPLRSLGRGLDAAGGCADLENDHVADDHNDAHDHDTAPQYHAPAASWTPVISPSSLLFYSGTQFPAWQGRALIGGLSSQSLVVVEIEGEKAREETRYDMGKRIREVEQGPDGAVWLLEDGANARLLKLTPR